MMKALIEIQGCGKSVRLQFDVDTLPLQIQLLDSITCFLKAFAARIELDAAMDDDEKTIDLQIIREQCSISRQMQREVLNHSRRFGRTLARLQSLPESECLADDFLAVTPSAHKVEHKPTSRFRLRVPELVRQFTTSFDLTGWSKHSRKAVHPDDMLSTRSSGSSLVQVSTKQQLTSDNALFSGADFSSGSPISRLSVQRNAF
jgi:hypothetical protein